MPFFISITIVTTDNKQNLGTAQKKRRKKRLWVSKKKWISISPQISWMFVNGKMKFIRLKGLSTGWIFVVDCLQASQPYWGIFQTPPKGRIAGGGGDEGGGKHTSAFSKCNGRVWPGSGGSSGAGSGRPSMTYVSITWRVKRWRSSSDFRRLGPCPCRHAESVVWG